MVGNYLINFVKKFDVGGLTVLANSTINDFDMAEVSRAKDALCA
jgi:hypothetical protein